MVFTIFRRGRREGSVAAAGKGRILAELHHHLCELTSTYNMYVLLSTEESSGQKPDRAALLFS